MSFNQTKSIYDMNKNLCTEHNDQTIDFFYILETKPEIKNALKHFRSMTSCQKWFIWFGISKKKKKLLTRNWIHFDDDT